MNNLQQDFLKQSIESLENLARQLQNEPNTGSFSENFSRQSFRTLHTIKGTSQTFGFPASGNLAHELENLLSIAKDGQIADRKNCKAVFLEGIGLLKKTFEQKNVEIPADFLEKLRLIAPPDNYLQTKATSVPDEIFSQLSGREKNVVATAERAGKNLFCLEIGFELSDFAEGITVFRANLSEKCEIIATLPSAKFAVPGKIGFQILLATAESFENIKNIVEKHFAEIVFQKVPVSFSNDLSGVFGHIASYGKSLAGQFGKEVDFNFTGAGEEVSAKTLKIIFDTLMHLVRNAIDHAVESPEERAANDKQPSGQINIQFSVERDKFHLTVSDDGRGIDAEKIRAKAVEEKLISDGDNLTEQAMLDLIFHPEFSTAEKLTEISGRGVGLDAVKDLLEKNGGEITVESQKGKGTTFEIRLPDEKLHADKND